MSKITIHLSSFSHRGREFIKVDLPNTDAAKNMIRSVTGRKWSQTNRCWYVPKTAAVYAELQEKFIVTTDKTQKLNKTEEEKIVLLVGKETKSSILPSYFEFKHPNGTTQKRITGQKIILLPEKETRFKVFVPFDKKGWIAVVKEIPGRAWNSEESYWSVPYVKDSFRKIWALGKEHILLNFVIRENIADKIVVPKTENKKKKNKPQITLNPMQQTAITVLEEKFILENKECEINRFKI